jgi:hypothetical protein
LDAALAVLAQVLCTDLNAVALVYLNALVVDINAKTYYFRTGGGASRQGVRLMVRIGELQVIS